MDHQKEFFERELDRTPYTAFSWLAGLALVLLIGGGIGLWHVATYAKEKRWLSGSTASGASDALFSNASDAANAALNTAQAAAAQEAQKQADAAKANATQALLDQSKAAINGVVDSAVKAAANSPSPSGSSGSGADTLQQYLKQ